MGFTVTAVGSDSITGRFSSQSFPDGEPLTTPGRSLRIRDSFISGQWTTDNDVGTLIPGTCRFDGRWIIRHRDDDYRKSFEDLIVAQGGQLGSIDDVFAATEAGREHELWKVYWADCAQQVVDQTVEWHAGGMPIGDNDTHGHCTICWKRYEEDEDLSGGVPRWSDLGRICGNCYDTLVVPRSLDFRNIYNYSP